jgi:hypothetical protein
MTTFYQVEPASVEVPSRSDFLGWVDSKVALSGVGDPLVFVVEVFGEMSSLLLRERNEHNRYLGEALKNRYSGTMTKGGWYSHIAVVFIDKEGQVANSQHVLASIEKTGIPQKLIFVIGIPVEARVAIDNNRKRTFGNHLEMKGYENFSDIASTISWLRRVQSGISGIPPYISNDEAEEFYLQNKEAIDVVNGIFKDAPFKRTEVRGPLAAVHPMFPEKVEEFSRLFATTGGTGWEEGTGPWLLRRYLDNYKGSARMEGTLLALLTLRALQIFITGEQCANLKNFSFRNPKGKRKRKLTLASVDRAKEILNFFGFEYERQR